MPDDGIDYIPVNPGGEPVDELLDTGARERRPRWLLPLAIAALLVIALIVVQHQHSSTPSAAPSQTTRSLPQRFRPVVTPSGGAKLIGGFERPLDRGANVLDVLVAPPTWWELKSRSITRWSQLGIQAQARLPVPVSPLRRPELVLDPIYQMLWLIEFDHRNTTLYSFDNATLRPRRVVHIAEPISAAVSTDGRLFLAERTRLVEVQRRGRPKIVARTPHGGFDSLVVDSARGGLLVASYSGSTSLWRATVGAGGAVRLSAPVRLPVIKATLGAVNGALWIGGYGMNGPVLNRLDPTTLRPVTRSPLLRAIDSAGVAIVADGVLDVWVRDPDTGKLYCMDSAAGNPLQSWTITGAVSSGGGTALVATTTGVIPLALRSCSG